MNIELLRRELDLIGDEALRKTVEGILRDISECMEHKPSSSTGKYHPAFDCEDGGNINHTKAVVRVLGTLLGEYESYEVYCIKVDNLYAAAILHDMCKYGEFPENSEHTVSDHPILAANLIRATYPDVARLIESHMGRWNEIRNEEKEVVGYLPIPISHEERLLHTADHIASQKWIDRSILNY